MEAFLNRLFSFKPGELRLVIILGSMLLCNSIAQKVSEISAVSNLLSDVGVAQILIVWTIDGVLLILTTGLQSLLIDRFNRIKLMSAVSLGLALAFLMLRLMFWAKAPLWLTYSLLYLLSQQQWLFFPLVFWILANDILDIPQTKRLFPQIASWGFAGGLLGIAFAAISPSLMSQFGIQSESLLTCNIVLYVLIYLVIQGKLPHQQLRQTRTKTITMQETLVEGWDFVRHVPAFRYLTIAVLAGVVCETILDFRFFFVSEAVFDNSSQYQTFYSFYLMGRAIIAIAVQTLLTRHLLSRLSLKNSFLIQPLASLMGAFCMLLGPNLLGSLSGIVLQKLPQYSVDETARKAFQGLVPEERRGRVSIFMDSYLIGVGGIVGSALAGVFVVLGLWFNHPTYYHYLYLVMAVIASFIALWAIWKMRQVYDNSLFNWRLKRRQRAKSVLENLDL